MDSKFLVVMQIMKNEKLSYCLETARRESLPKIAEITIPVSVDVGLS